MRPSLLSIATAATLTLLPLTTFAHEHRTFTIGEKTYSIVIGSMNEPVRVDDKSGVEMMVADMTGVTGDAEGTPVTGLESTLKVEVSAGKQKKTFDLRPLWGEAGSYNAVFYPTVQTSYTYRVFGTINGVAFDVPFTCKPAETETAPEDTAAQQISNGVTQTQKSGAFGCPGSRSDVSFPSETMSAAELTDEVDDFDGSLSFGIMGMVFGIIGMATGTQALQAIRKQ